MNERDKILLVKDPADRLTGRPLIAVIELVIAELEATRASLLIVRIQCAPTPGRGAGTLLEFKIHRILG
eukprot:SAG11_NODE_12_length_27025_cov_37.402681_10_plen_69_part_00